MALPLTLAVLLLLDLPAEHDQLLKGEQASAALRKALEALMKALTLCLAERAIALGGHLGGQVEDRLLERPEKVLAEDLKVERQVPVQGPVRLPYPPADPLQVLPGFSQGT
jgi:hypothetical protein